MNICSQKLIQTNRNYATKKIKNKVENLLIGDDS